MTNEELCKAYQAAADLKDGVSSNEVKERNNILQQLIKQNEGMIHQLAYKHSRTKAFVNQNSIAIEDLEQEGIIGLIRAIEKWDESKGAAFITYAVYWINQKIYRCLHPRVSSDNFQEVSLQAPIAQSKEGDPLTREDLLQEDWTFKKNPYDAVDDEEFCKEIHRQADELMDKVLSLKAREIVKMSVGWEAAPMSNEEIGQVFNISPRAVGSYKQNAYSRLRCTRWAMDLEKEHYTERLMRKHEKRYDSIGNNEVWRYAGKSAEEIVKEIMGKEGWKIYQEYKEKLKNKEA